MLVFTDTKRNSLSVENLATLGMKSANLSLLGITLWGLMLYWETLTDQ